MSSPEPSSFPIADAAQAYLRRRWQRLIRLERAERALRRWDAWETDLLLPEELRRPVVRPVLHREGLNRSHTGSRSRPGVGLRT